MNATYDQVREYGFRLDDVFISANKEILDYNTFLKKILDYDLRRQPFVTPFFPSEVQISNVSESELLGTVILQVVSVANISESLKRQQKRDSSNSSVHKIILTDGHSKAPALALQQIPGINTETSPGTKVRYFGGRILNGHLLVTPANLRHVGGCVDYLHQAFLANQTAQRIRLIKGFVSKGDKSSPPVFEPLPTLTDAGKGVSTLRSLVSDKINPKSNSVSINVVASTVQTSSTQRSAQMHATNDRNLNSTVHESSLQRTFEPGERNAGKKSEKRMEPLDCSTEYIKCNSDSRNDRKHKDMSADESNRLTRSVQDISLGTTSSSNEKDRFYRETSRGSQRNLGTTGRGRDCESGRDSSRDKKSDSLRGRSGPRGGRSSGGFQRRVYGAEAEDQPHSTTGQVSVSLSDFMNFPNLPNSKPAATAATADRSKPTIGVDWACKNCTFQNNSQLAYCEMCETSR